MTTGGFSSKRLARVRDVLERHVDAGYVPGAVAVVARHGEVHVESTGNLAFEGEGSGAPMAADTICRIASMTKPIVAACAMTLVEDCTLRLDDPAPPGEMSPRTRNTRLRQRSCDKGTRFLVTGNSFDPAVGKTVIRMREVN